MIPLVEAVGGRQTSEAATQRAMAFHAACGKRPIRLRREMRGHVANRLQAALWQEAFHLVREGVADMADVDAAIAHGPGLRWALLGPFPNLHLSGREGGIRHMLEHLGPPTDRGPDRAAAAQGALAGAVVALAEVLPGRPGRAHAAARASRSLQGGMTC